MKVVEKSCRFEGSDESAVRDRSNDGNKQILRRFVLQNDRIGLPEAAPCLVVGDVCLGTPSDIGS